MMSGGAHWHSSRLLCSRSSVQFMAGPGDFVGLILFCIRMALYTPVARQVGLVLEHFPFTNAASRCMWIWFADFLPALVGFLWALRFPRTPKNQNPFISVDRTSKYSHPL